MKERYVVERFPRYMILGEKEETVDIYDTNGNEIVCNVSREDAHRIIGDRHRVIDMLTDLALNLDVVDPSTFEAIWYGMKEDK